MSDGLLLRIGHKGMAQDEWQRAVSEMFRFHHHVLVHR